MSRAKVEAPIIQRQIERLTITIDPPGSTGTRSCTSDFPKLLRQPDDRYGLKAAMARWVPSVRFIPNGGGNPAALDQATARSQTSSSTSITCTTSASRNTPSTPLALSLV
jgi:hypothetical protein